MTAGAHSGERWRGQAASRRAGCCRGEDGGQPEEHHLRKLAASLQQVTVDWDVRRVDLTVQVLVEFPSINSRGYAC